MAAICCRCQLVVCGILARNPLLLARYIFPLEASFVGPLRRTLVFGLGLIDLGSCPLVGAYFDLFHEYAITITTPIKSRVFEAVYYYNTF